MRVIIKKMQGGELVTEVNESTTVLDIKKEVMIHFQIPAWKQKMLFQGKKLVDENRLTEYKMIKDGCKINLLVLEPEPLDACLQKVFKKYYPQEQAEKYATDINADLIFKIKNMSWNDIERISKYYREEQNGNIY